MKKSYLKPDAQYIDLDIKEHIMDSFFEDSWGVGEKDEEGV